MAVPSFPAWSRPRRYDDPVTALRRRVASVLLVAVAVAGCGSTVKPSASPSASARPSAAEPSLTPVPGGNPTPEATLPTTTETDFGPVWDALPATWPRFPGQSQSEVGTDASDRLIVHGRPIELAGQLDAALTKLGWTVDVGSPLEDGSVVLDASGAPVGCKAEARFAPNPPDGDPVIIDVYYGAKCPFS